MQESRPQSSAHEEPSRPSDQQPSEHAATWRKEGVGAETKPMRSPSPTTTRQALKTPRAAAIAGILFSVLLAISIVLIRLALLSDPRDTSVWANDQILRSEIVTALNLIPFAGIAFLWFIGVVRDRMGQDEDRFFATVFLGSGLLFVAMLFAAAAVAGGVIVALTDTSGGVSSDALRLGRGITYALISTYAMRMAAVFTLSTTLIARRIAIMPRWIVLDGLLTAVILFLGSGFVPWLELLFPMWVLLVSVEILIASWHPRHMPSTPNTTRPTRANVPAESTP